MTETITKRRSDAPEGMFALEVAGLRWLADAGPDAVPVVAVVEHDQHHLILTKISRAQPDQKAAEEFGRRLVLTHDSGAPAWGSPPAGHDGPDAWIGALDQRNVIEETWGLMYAEHRVRHPARIAHERGVLDSDDLAEVERFADRLAEGAFDDDTSPARIHGDLWSGNVIPARNGFTLIDPAAHGGHRITDLAMLELFGHPYLETTFAAYEEASAQLPDQWRDLIPLHQVHPLLVHTALFGGSYAHQAMTAIRRHG